MKLVHTSLFIFACALSFGASAAYPEKPVTILVGSATGGGIDLLARQVGKLMSASLGQPIVVENRAGAAGLIAVEATVKAKPDGYTLLMGTGAVTALPHQQKVNFDPLSDFTPVTQFGSAAVYFLVNSEYAASNSINTLNDLIRVAKAKPGQLNYGTTGPSSTTSMTMAQFENRTGVDIVPITYKGTVPVATALLAGEIHLMIGTPEQVQAQLTAGKLKALAVTSSKRLPTMKEVPTVAEAANLPGFNSTVWYGLLAPPRTPNDVVARLHKEGVAAIKSPSLRQQLDNIGFEITGSSPQEFAAFMKEDYARQGAIVKMQNASPRKQ
jgi:tripartite-type tricarboxylate transporter receptor subunit TctC